MPSHARRVDPFAPAWPICTAISAEEFGLEGATAQLQQLFDAIDGDEDGSLSTAELKSFHE